jgi:hypothetical protein
MSPAVQGSCKPNLQDAPTLQSKGFRVAVLLGGGNTGVLANCVGFVPIAEPFLLPASPVVGAAVVQSAA